MINELGVVLPSSEIFTTIPTGEDDLWYNRPSYVNFKQNGSVDNLPHLIQLTYQPAGKDGEAPIIIHIGSTTSLGNRAGQLQDNNDSALLMVQIDPNWEKILAAYPLYGSGQMVEFPKTLVSIRDRERKRRLPFFPQGNTQDPFYGFRVKYNSDAETLQLENLAVRGVQVSTIGTQQYEIGNPPGKSQ